MDLGGILLGAGLAVVGGIMGEVARAKIHRAVESKEALEFTRSCIDQVVLVAERVEGLRNPMLRMLLAVLSPLREILAQLREYRATGRWVRQYEVLSLLLRLQVLMDVLMDQVDQAIRAMSSTQDRSKAEQLTFDGQPASTVLANSALQLGRCARILQCKIDEAERSQGSYFWMGE